MKKIILISALSLISMLGYSQSSRFRVKNNTKFGWVNKTVPVKAYSDSTWDAILFKEDLPNFGGGFWGLQGNALGNNTSFLGSTDNRSVRFRSNNIDRFKIDSLGYVYSRGVGGDIDNTIFGNLSGGTTFASTVEGTTIYGYNSGHAITTSIINTFFGAYNGLFLTAGANNNTLIGYGLFSNALNTNNIGNTIVGYNAGTGALAGANYNTVVGASSALGNVSNNIVLSDGQGNIKYRWNGTTNAITGPLTSTGTYSNLTAGQGVSIKEGVNGLMGQIALIAGTRAISIANVTTSSRAFITLVTPTGVTLTTAYQAVCTAGVLTLQANVAAGTINVADGSTLNYIIFQPN